MHELGLAENLCNTVIEHAGKKNVIRVIIEIGAFSGVNRDAFEFCSDAVFRQNLNEQIEIVLQAIPGKARCECGEVYETNDLLSACPKCGEFTREIIEGTDLILKSIEVE